MIDVARTAPTFGLICSETVVVPPFGVKLLTVTHVWNGVTGTKRIEIGYQAGSPYWGWGLARHRAAQAMVPAVSSNYVVGLR